MPAPPPDADFTRREFERLISSVDKLSDTMSRVELRLNDVSTGSRTASHVTT